MLVTAVAAAATGGSNNTGTLIGALAAAVAVILTAFGFYSARATKRTGATALVTQEQAISAYKDQLALKNEQLIDAKAREETQNHRIKLLEADLRHQQEQILSLAEQLKTPAKVEELRTEVVVWHKETVTKLDGLTNLIKAKSA